MTLIPTLPMTSAPSTVTRRLAGLLLAALACAVHAQAPAPAAAPAKVAITSLVGDTLTVSTHRLSTGTSMQSNLTQVLKVPGPMFDHAVLNTVEQALKRTRPDATVTLLKVPAAGSADDPAQLLADGKVASGSALIDGLQQQGYTHLLVVSRLRASNRVALVDGRVGEGQLEGLGFYVDPYLIVVQTDSQQRFGGVVAPHLYVQLALVDLSTQQVRAVQNVFASTAFGGTWEATNAQTKADALDRLIRRHVAEAVPLLFAAKQGPGPH